MSMLGGIRTRDSIRKSREGVRTAPTAGVFSRSRASHGDRGEAAGDRLGRAGVPGAPAQDPARDEGPGTHRRLAAARIGERIVTRALEGELLATEPAQGGGA
jgi:hypothetical protein